ncbi:hypothetical protein PV11_00497 [Exophiala sideris]|uniref:Uncharacterized protein n=2 Tax=Exophiala sideris TaxID=1016849 RepID=A0A0D1XA30_9EURO|nr:hypothetical protein PV11_00497 [Exophiala sideris]
MHKYRREAKYAAWYNDPVDGKATFGNPFAKWRPNLGRSDTIPTLEDGQITVEDDQRTVEDLSQLPSSRKRQVGSGSEREGLRRLFARAARVQGSAEEQPSAAHDGPTQNDANEVSGGTLDFDFDFDFDFESTPSEKTPSRRSPLLRIPGFLYVAGRLFSSTVAAENQSASSSARLLPIAEQIFRRKAKSRAILSELTFEEVTTEPTADDANALPEQVPEKAISSVKNAINIDIETIRRNSRQGIKIVYILNDEALSEELVTSSLRNPPRDSGLGRFRHWAHKVQQRRGAMKKSAHWILPRMSQAQGLEFALGLEHCASFSPGKDHKGILKIVSELRRLGSYEQSSFAKVSQFHKRSLYFYQMNTPSHETSSDAMASERMTCKKGPQFLMVISQSSPCHYETDEPGYTSWTDPAYWQGLLEPYTGPVQHSDLNLSYYGLIRDLIAGVMGEADEAWNARIVEVLNDVEQFSSQVYDCPSDIVSSDHLWSLSQYLSEMQQAISSQADLMGLIQEELQRYAADQATLASETMVIERWNTLRRESWLEALISGMKDSEQSVRGVIREVDRLLDRVS